MFAFAVAVGADLIQLPITALEDAGAFLVPGELADFVVDCFVMVVTTALLGFHWALLPSLIVEMVPELDLIPTWTGCVAFVVWQRRREQKPPPAVPDVPAVQMVPAQASLANPSSSTALNPSSQSPSPTSVESGTEKRA